MFMDGISLFMNDFRRQIKAKTCSFEPKVCIHKVKERIRLFTNDVERNIYDKVCKSFLISLLFSLAAC